MTQIRIHETQMPILLEFIKKICGNDLSSKKEILKNKISLFCKNNGISSLDELIERINLDRYLRQNLINQITINETYFSRENNQLRAVIDYANSLGTYVSILCAPCSTGEEVYTLGILAKNIGMDKYKLKITGIDINSSVIEKSKIARYSKRSLQNITEYQKTSYFTEEEDGFFSIKKEYMPKTEFHVMNLFDDNIFRLGVFDIILSRNMLIYFDEYHRAISLERFYKLLKPEGRLYVGSADIVPSSELFDKIVDLSTTYYQKKAIN